MKSSPQSDQPCPECDSSPSSRRQFLKASGGALAATAVGGVLGGIPSSGSAKINVAEAKPATDSESLVRQLFTGLTQEQLHAITFPWDHPDRLRVENNWHIVKEQRVGQLFDRDQQALIREIFMKLHSEEYRDQVLHQFIHDNRGRGLTTEEEIFGSASVALFGAPGTGKFEFVFTGRHCTRRCDGDSEAGAAFGGPIFYGHAARSFNEDPGHPDNVYWYQAQQANQVFQMLDGKQRDQALKGEGRDERGSKTVELTGKAEGLDGIAVSELTVDQKEQVRKVLADLLMPFREADRAECLKLVEPQFEQLHMAFYRNQDIGKDGIWDVWQIEGPNMVWYFRGDPHVHTWVHVRGPEHSQTA